VGAQAVHLHTGAADLAVAEYATDSDVAIDRSALRPEPRLGESLTARLRPRPPGGRKMAGGQAAGSGCCDDPPDELKAKDALDILRLLRPFPSRGWLTGYEPSAARS
jgi:hypothetical protein